MCYIRQNSTLPENIRSSQFLVLNFLRIKSYHSKCIKIKKHGGITMADIRVTFPEAEKAFIDSLTIEERYTFKKLSKVLQTNFKGINSSQISGLIFRATDGENSLLNKCIYSDKPGVYAYSINDKWDKKNELLSKKDTLEEYSLEEIKMLFNNILSDSIIDLNKLKEKINDSDVFLFLQSKIDEVKKTKI